MSAQDLELALLSTSLPSFHLFFLATDIDHDGDIDHADDEYDAEDDDMTVIAMMMMAMMVVVMMVVAMIALLSTPLSSFLPFILSS